MFSLFLFDLLFCFLFFFISVLVIPSIPVCALLRPQTTMLVYVFCKFFYVFLGFWIFSPLSDLCDSSSILCVWLIPLFFFGGVVVVPFYLNLLLYLYLVFELFQPYN